MTPQRKLLLLFLAFAILGLASLHLLVRGRPGAPDFNPLDKIETSDIKKIRIDPPTGSVTLERRGAEWHLASPMEDAADPGAVENLVETLKNFSVGSMVSERSDRYGQFGLEPGAAIRVRVFAAAPEAPALDGWIGNQATTFQSSYFRLETATAVFIANNLPGYVFRKWPDDYRQRQLLPHTGTGASTVVVETGGKKISLSRSSATWTDDNSSRPVDSAWVAALLGKLERLKAVGFEDASSALEKAGLEKPFLKINIQNSTVSATAVVGNKVPPVGKIPSANRYARTEGRSAVLLIPIAAIDDLLAYLKTLPR